MGMNLLKLGIEDERLEENWIQANTYAAGSMCQPEGSVSTFEKRCFFRPHIIVSHPGKAEGVSECHTGEMQLH